MAAVRVGLVGDDFIINPTYAEIEAGDLDLIVAGSPEGVIMVEAGANQLPERDIIEAIDFGYEAVRDLIKAQEDLVAELGLKIVYEAPPAGDPILENYIRDHASQEIKKILAQFELTKIERDIALDAVKDSIAVAIAELPDSRPHPDCGYSQQQSTW